MAQHVETLPEMVNQPKCPERTVQLLTQYFAVVRESFGATTEYWDGRAIDGVCCGEPRDTLRLMSPPLLPTGHGITNPGHG